MNRIRVLVTAAGGQLGQAVIKSLRLSVLPLELIGCDSSADTSATAFVDHFHIVPRAGMPGYLDAIDHLCAQTKCAAVIPATDAEIAALNGSMKLPAGAVVVAQPAEWYALYSDKLNCYRALAGHVDLAPFADGLDREAVDRLVEQAGLPCVVKPRWSSGARAIHTCATRDSLSAALAEVPRPVAQGYIDDTAGEFSVAVFGDSDYLAVGFRRELVDGTTGYAETTDDADVLGYALSIAKRTTLRGSANIQVRKSAAGVRLLEINARFSSLAAARAIAGFFDVEWSLTSALGLPRRSSPLKPRSLRFRRYTQELIDFGQGFATPVQWLPRTTALKVPRDSA